MSAKKIISVVLTLMLTFIMLSGCTVKNNENDSLQKESTQSIYPLKITDSYGRTVTIEKEPKRVVSAAPNITEIIYALEKGETLVGRTDLCNYPTEVAKVSSIGGMQDASIEKIVALKPDVVIASAFFTKEMVQKLEKLNIKVLALYGPESFDGAYDVITQVGKVLNVELKADQVIDEMKDKVKSVEKRVKHLDKPSVYYVISFGKSGDYTAGKDTFIGQMIEMAGGRNAAEDVKGWQYSLERLIKNDPDMIVCARDHFTKNGFISADGYKQLKAVKQQRVFEVDGDAISRPGPRLADALVELSNIIHPVK